MNMTLLLIVVIVVGGLLLSLVVASTFSVDKKSFTPYSAPVSQNSSSPSSLDVSNVNGGVTVVSWGQPNVLVNGTVTARGLGASVNAVTFVESNATGTIVFHAVFPGSTISFPFFPSYTVDINVYVPASAEFASAHIITVNGDIKLSTIETESLTLTTTNGKVQATGITAHSLTLTTTNGSLDFTCSSCISVVASTTNGGITGNLISLSLTGSYTLTTTNGGISLALPASGSFRLSANTVNGGISVSGLGLTAQTSHSLTATVGTGAASVNLTTTNGSISVTGT